MSRILLKNLAFLMESQHLQPFPQLDNMAGDCYLSSTIFLVFVNDPASRR
jgi:hypothetical protein